MAQALIIGGSTGVGQATAELLLAQGHEVAIVARNTANLSKVEAALGAQGTVRVYALVPGQLGGGARLRQHAGSGAGPAEIPGKRC